MKVNKIDSNVTGLRYAEEASIGVLPVTPNWIPLEPNSYNDFGGNLTLLARNPINQSRQRKKGVITDLDASGGYNTDLTQKNLQDMLQGFMFADSRRKGEGISSSIDGALEKIEMDHAEGMFVNSLIFNAGFTNSQNNGLKRITAVNSVKATGLLTFAGQPANNDTVTLGTQVYTWKTALTGAAYEVFIGATAALSRDNLVAAITAGAGSGTAYGTGTLAHTLVTASPNVGNMNVTALRDGPGGNTIATTEAGANTSFGAATLTGGDADVTVAENLVTETPVAGAATVVVVGFQFAAADATITNGGVAFPVFGATAKDLTTLGLVPGEWFFIGGDALVEQFNTAVNNNFVRARSITATQITLDKSSTVLVTDAGAGKTIRIFLGRVLKNELGTLVKRRTYQLERTLGAPDESFPNQVQAEYLVGSVPNELALNVATADKITADVSFVSTDNEQRTAAQGLKSGNRPSLAEADAFNSSSDFNRIKMSLVSLTDAFPTPLFAFVTDLTLTINNNVSPNKAIGVLGAFEVTAGIFTVTGSLTAYFSDVAAVSAVRNNSDITLDMVIVKANAGIVIDIPLIALGDGRANIEQDQPVTLPLSLDAATAAKIASTLDYTLLFSFFDYLPNLAA